MKYQIQIMKIIETDSVDDVLSKLESNESLIRINKNQEVEEEDK